MRVGSLVINWFWTAFTRRSGVELEGCQEGCEEGGLVGSQGW